MKKIKRALLSLSDKSQLEPLVRTLNYYGIEILSTGGTKRAIEALGLPCIGVSEITGKQEIFEGRVKTLDYKISGGILMRRSKEQDLQEAKGEQIKAIDLVVCNLYPFEKMRQKIRCLDELSEFIDIGGPTMIRSAAKNFNDVVCITCLSQYAGFFEQLEKYQGGTDLDFRLDCCADAFKLTANYDMLIANDLLERRRRGHERFMRLGVARELRYGENPHQSATSFFLDNISGDTPANVVPLQGKTLSYNNLLDSDSAWKICSELHQFTKRMTSVVVKHGNPCGVAVGSNPVEVLTKSWECDSVSAFGSVICLSAEVTTEMANWIRQRFVEIIIAPGFSARALEILSAKKNLRLLKCPLKSITGEWTARSVAGAMIVQNEDEQFSEEIQMKSNRALSKDQEILARFGIICVKYLKSNALALVRSEGDQMFLQASGVGQPNRLDCLQYLIAARSTGQDLSHSLLISDAFFPFDDIAKIAHKLGIEHIVQPGGSIRDDEVIATVDQLGQSMAFTQTRHFRH